MELQARGACSCPRLLSVRKQGLAPPPAAAHGFSRGALRVVAFQPSSQQSVVTSQQAEFRTLTQQHQQQPPTFLVVPSQTQHQSSADQQHAAEAPAVEVGRQSKQDEFMSLLRKNNSTQNLIEVRAARIEALQAAMRSRGLPMPPAAIAAAAEASEDVLQDHFKLANHLLDDYEALVALNQALMRKCRAQNTQIMAMETELSEAGHPLPKRTLSSASYSSVASSSSSSFSSTGTVGEEELRAAVPPGRPPQGRRAHTVRCVFKVKCVTRPGQRLFIVGSVPPLGSWDMELGKALPLHWTEGHIWQGEISLDEFQDYYSPRIVSFKAVLQEVDGRLQWQRGMNQEVILGPSMGHHVNPCVATIDFTEPESNSLPLNYEEACAATYYINFDSDVPEAYARQKAAQEVDQFIKKLKRDMVMQPVPA